MKGTTLVFGMLLLVPMMLGLEERSIKNSPAEPRKEAYVTFAHGEDFFLSVKVMIMSLRKTGTSRDIVVMVPNDKDEVPDSMVRDLEALQVKVIRLPAIDNPFLSKTNTPARFKIIFTKLQVWNLEQYERVVYLDADMIVVENIDDLFRCGEFCVAFINPAIFNSGLMVIKPSKAIFQDMLQKFPIYGSYSGGDQGFLNVYYPDMLSKPLFDPNKTKDSVSGFHRIPTKFNMDHTLYYPRMGWDVPDLRPKVLHFLGLSFIKPCYWWSYPLNAFKELYASHREDLPVSLQENRFPTFLILLILPPLFLFLFFSNFNSLNHTSFYKLITTKFSFKTLLHLQASQAIVYNSIFGFLSFFLASTLPFLLIPYTIPPVSGWILFFEWQLFMIVICFTLGFGPFLPQYHSEGFAILSISPIKHFLIILWMEHTVFAVCLFTHFRSLETKVTFLSFGVISVLAFYNFLICLQPLKK